MLSQCKQEWFGNIRADILSGMVVALALIPESIAFSVIAGVDPKVGLYASFCIATVIAFAGGRTAMISAATGAMALIITSLVAEHGLQYLLAATLLTGVLQIMAALLRLGSLLRFISKSVMIGFVNALAILMFIAQLSEFNNAGGVMYAFVAVGLVIIYGLPRITKVVPASLVAIIVLTIAAIFLDAPLRTVGDKGALPESFPVFMFPDIPWNMETLKIILPYSLTLTAVGLLESLMTAVILDDITDTPSNKNRECAGQGIANIVASLFGGMAGCAMIGQSVINVKSGGRGRLSTLVAGCFLLFLILVLDDWVRQIPMAALVAVMIMVCISSFSWASIIHIRTTPKTSSAVMLATVAVVVATHDLAQGVFVGVLLSGLFFAHKVSHMLRVELDYGKDATRTYRVYGQVFFASTEKFISQFDMQGTMTHVIIDVSHAHFWDISAIAALDRIVMKCRRRGADVTLLGLNEASATMVDKFAIHDKKASNHLGLHL